MQCAICYRATILGCSLCSKVFYCSKAHQQKHWTKHKIECKGRPKRVLDQQYGTYSQNYTNSPPSSPMPYNKIFKSKEKANQKQQQVQPKQTQKQRIRKQQLKLLDKVHQFVEKSEVRKDERLKILFSFTKGKQKQLIFQAKKLVENSQKLYRQFQNQMSRLLMEKFRIRTSKYIQQIELFLDICFLYKLYVKCDMRQQLKKLCYSQKIPNLPEHINIVDFNNPVELEKYKLWKLEVMNCKTILALLASIANTGGFTSYTELVYKNYIYLIEKSFGINQQFLAYFLVGNWYAQIRQYNKAKACFEYCKDLKSNDSTQDQIVGDCYFNIAICSRMVNEVQQSIQHMHQALIFRRSKNSISASICLQFIGKQLIQLCKYNQALQALKQCYTIRKSQLSQNDSSIISLIEIIKKLISKTQQKQKLQNSRMNIEQASERQKDLNRLQKQFNIALHNESIFEDNKLQEQNKVIQLKFDSEWIDDLGVAQFQNLTQIIQQIKDMSPQEAKQIVINSKFFQSLSQERKEKLKEMNYDLFN